MFICPEIETVGFTPRQLFNIFVCEKRADTNETFIQGITADGDNGTWQRLKRGYVKADDVSPSWFAKEASLKMLGRFPPLHGDYTRTSFTARTGIALDSNFTDTQTYRMDAADAFELDSPFWFTVMTPDGLSLMLPEAAGTDRGTVFQSDVVLRQIFDRDDVGYCGEGADVEIYPSGAVYLPSLAAQEKSRAINKFRASLNYIVFAASKVYACGDYVRSWDGRRYVILSGRRVDVSTWHYTAVLECTDVYSAPSVVYGTGSVDGKVGVIEAFGGASVPVGWFACNGASLMRSLYPDLYAAIGTAWGTADSTHFNAPDGRGLTLRGVDGGAGRDSDRASRTALKTGGNTGDNVGSYQADAYASHRHYSNYGPMIVQNTAGGVYVTASGSVKVHYNDPATRYTDYSGGNETRPKNVGVNFIIKY